MGVQVWLKGHRAASLKDALLSLLSEGNFDTSHQCRLVLGSRSILCECKLQSRGSSWGTKRSLNPAVGLKGIAYRVKLLNYHVACSRGDVLKFWMRLVVHSLPKSGRKSKWVLKVVAELESVAVIINIVAGRSKLLFGFVTCPSKGAQGI